MSNVPLYCPSYAVLITPEFFFVYKHALRAVSVHYKINQIQSHVLLRALLEDLHFPKKRSLGDAQGVRVMRAIA